MLNLSLEHLGTLRPVKSVSPMYMAEAYIGMIEAIQNLENCSTAMNNLIVARGTLLRYGRTRSLEALIGTSTLNAISNKTVATEGLKEMWQAFITWIKRIWAKVKDFFRALFNSNKKMQERLAARIQELTTNDKGLYRVSIPDLHKAIPLLNSIKGIVGIVKKTINDIKAQNGSEISKNGQELLQFTEFSEKVLTILAEDAKNDSTPIGGDMLRDAMKATLQMLKIAEDPTKALAELEPQIEAAVQSLGKVPIESPIPGIPMDKIDEVAKSLSDKDKEAIVGIAKSILQFISTKVTANQAKINRRLVVLAGRLLDASKVSDEDEKRYTEVDK